MTQPSWTPDRIGQFLKSVALPLPRTTQGWRRIEDSLTHPSFAYENGLSTNGAAYERLEFLGDAILKWVVSDALFEMYPQHEEGELTKIRAFCISDKTLSVLARSLGLPTVMRLGVSELKANGLDKTSNLACCLEALLGAIYLNEGPVVVSKWVKTQWEPLLRRANDDSLKDNYKAALQEWTQAHQMGLPDYRTELEWGPAHAKQFRVGVWVLEKRMGVGEGPSKKAAQQEAAKQALMSLCPPPSAQGAPSPSPVSS